MAAHRLGKSLSTSSWIAIAFVSAVALSCAGCGVKGPMEPPPEAKAVGDAKSPSDADPGQNSAAPPKAHEPFVLDPLLR